MNELDRKRMLTIAKMVRNIATTEGWKDDDQMLILAKLAISAYEEIVSPKGLEGRVAALEAAARVVCAARWSDERIKAIEELGWVVGVEADSASRPPFD